MSKSTYRVAMNRCLSFISLFPMAKSENLAVAAVIRETAQDEGKQKLLNCRLESRLFRGSSNSNCGLHGGLPV
jgi:hypothetical protein